MGAECGYSAAVGAAEVRGCASGTSSGAGPAAAAPAGPAVQVGEIADPAYVGGLVEDAQGGRV
ncbi:hypothetical protein, partial [Streptomyces catenulae]